MTKEDVKQLSQMAVTSEDSSVNSSSVSDNSDKVSKSKLEMWNPLTFGFLNSTISKPTEKLKKGWLDCTFFNNELECGCYDFEI